MVTIAQIPHLAWPPRIGPDGTFETVGQDTVEEHRQAVELLLHTPLGGLIDTPRFGTPEQAFKTGGADISQLEATVERWEPRTRRTITRTELAALAQNVNVEVQANG
jgi:phage baseplate assembly protein W